MTTSPLRGEVWRFGIVSDHVLVEVERRLKFLMDLP